jgi:hypothetical protein
MTPRIFALIGAICVLLLPTAASAYIGPGAGASLASSLLGVLAAIGTAIMVVLFWPLRLIYKKIRGNRPASDNTATANESSASVAD